MKMEKLVETLDEMLEKYKKSSLSKNDFNNVIELLREVRVHEVQGEKFFHYLAAFPSKIISQTVIEILKGLDEMDHEDFIWKIISSNEFDKYQTYLKQLNLSKYLLQQFTSLSLYVLINFAEKVTQSGSKPVSSNVAKIFAEDFIINNQIFSWQLDGYIGEKQFSSLSVLIFGSLTICEIDEVLFGKVVAWLSTPNKKILIPRNIKNKFEIDTKNWSIELKKTLVKLGVINRILEIERLPSDVKIFYLPNNQEEVISTKVLGNKIENELNSTKEKNLENNEPKIIKSSDAVFEKLRIYLNELEFDSKKKSEEILKLQSELYKTKSSRDFLEQKLNDIEKTLFSEREEMKVLINKNYELLGKVTELETNLLEKGDEFEKNKNQLIDIGQHESEYAVKAFKNRLKKNLRVEYMDFREIQADEMTIQLGESVRKQLKYLFAQLDKEGVSFDGGGIQ